MRVAISLAGAALSTLGALVVGGSVPASAPRVPAAPLSRPAGARSAGAGSATPPAGALPADGPSAAAALRPAGPVEAGRAAYVWHPPAPSTLVGQARRWGVTTLLVWVSPGVSSRPAEIAGLRRLHAAAATAGLRLVALCGDPSWVGAPAVAARWAREVTATGLFAGLHLDIEPHTLPAWRTDPAPLARGMLAALRAVRAASPLPVAADIPSWYDTVTVDGTPLDRSVLATVDEVTVMAYRNTAAAEVAAARSELADAAAAGRPAMVGLNVDPPNGDPAFTSFAGSSPAVVRAALAALAATGPRLPGYAGTTVNDLEHLAALR